MNKMNIKSIVNQVLKESNGKNVISFNVEFRYDGQILPKDILDMGQNIADAIDTQIANVGMTSDTTDAYITGFMIYDSTGRKVARSAY